MKKTIILISLISISCLFLGYINLNAQVINPEMIAVETADTLSKPIDNSPFTIDRKTWTLPEHIKQNELIENWTFDILSHKQKEAVVSIWFYNANGENIAITRSKAWQISMEADRTKKSWRLSKTFHSTQFPIGTTIWQLYNFKTKEVYDEGKFEIYK